MKVSQMLTRHDEIARQMASFILADRDVSENVVMWRTVAFKNGLFEGLKFTGEDPELINQFIDEVVTKALEIVEHKRTTE